MPRKPKADKPKPLFDLSLVPGTKRDQILAAERMLRQRRKPIAVVRDGNKWRVDVLGVTIGYADTKTVACSAAFSVGMYRLELGQFADTYIENWCQT